MILTYQPVKTHEDQSVNARVSGDINQILNNLAPDIAERPVRQHEVGGREWYTKYNEQQISHGEVDDEDVRGRPHSRIRRHHHDHQRIPRETENSDYTKEQWYHHHHDAVHQFVFEFVVIMLAGLDIVRERAAIEERVAHIRYFRLHIQIKPRDRPAIESNAASSSQLR